MLAPQLNCCACHRLKSMQSCFSLIFSVLPLAAVAQFGGVFFPFLNSRGATTIADGLSLGQQQIVLEPAGVGSIRHRRSF